MSRHRVLIISDQPLFAQGVRTLVETKTDSIVIGVEEFDANTLEHVARLQPDIVILGDEQDGSGTMPLALLDTVAVVRVIRLSLGGNMIHVYDGRRLVANCVDDLVGALQESSPV